MRTASIKTSIKTNIKKRLIFPVGILMAIILFSSACGSDSGGGSSSAEAIPTTSISARYITAGREHTCAILKNRTVRCWGDNSSGQLGNGRSGNEGINVLAVQVQDINSGAHIDAGPEYTCAVLRNGRVMCWGLNSAGQLGNGRSGRDSIYSSPVEVIGIDSAKQVAAGHRHACALLKNGDVWCWGSNSSGQLGNGQLGEDATLPVQVLDIDSASQIVAGGDHTCALLKNGEVQCWGENYDHQLGGSRLDETASPVQVSNIDSAVQIDAGRSHTCVLTEDKRVWCWGDNDFGQLGDRDGGSSRSPTRVSSIISATQITAGDSHTCAVLEDGTARCWGSNSAGQLGDNRRDSDDTVLPIRVLNIDSAALISAGRSHTCAVLENDRVECWGSNDSGKLG